MPRLQHAQEGLRHHVVTVVPATTKSEALGGATAARPSLGPAVSCVLPADTGPTAKVRGKPMGRTDGLYGDECST